MPTQSTSSGIARLLEIMALLRDPERGCPWDVEQNFATIAPHTIEEAYEVADAIEKNDMAELRDELGDLLLQVVFHAQMADEAGEFDFAGVCEAINDKLIRRHPHVFGDLDINDAASQTVAWEDHKAKERKQKAVNANGGGNEGNGNGTAGGTDGDDEPHSALDGVILGLPALTRAYKLQKRAARVGFDWDDAGPVIDKVREELGEVTDELAAETVDRDRLEDELGDLLFCCVNLARKLGVEPETALRRGNNKFERRFRALEERLAAQDKDIHNLPVLEILDKHWERIKEAEKKSG